MPSRVGDERAGVLDLVAVYDVRPQRGDQMGQLLDALGVRLRVREVERHLTGQLRIRRMPLRGKEVDIPLRDRQ